MAGPGLVKIGTATRAASTGSSRDIDAWQLDKLKNWRHSGFSVDAGEAPLKPLPDPIPLKIQSPFNNDGLTAWGCNVDANFLLTGLKPLVSAAHHLTR